jgi:hypothetical protein
MTRGIVYVHFMGTTIRDKANLMGAKTLLHYNKPMGFNLRDM